MVIILVSISACSKENIYLEDTEDTTPLQIYLLMDNSDDFGLSKFVDSYNSQLNRNSKLDIEIVKYFTDEAEIMYEDILNGISLGKGPDIILIDSMADKYMDIAKISQQNAFADMDILIENSESFDMTDYNRAALDAGVIDGKRVFMPISYKVEYMMTAKECFENNYLEVPEKLTIETYLDLLEAYYKQEKTNPAMLGIEMEYILSSIINDEGKFNNDSLTRRLFEILKEENKRGEITKATKYYKFNTWEEYFSNVGAFINANYLFFNTDYSYNTQFKNIHLQYNIVEKMCDSSFLWYKYPLSNDGLPLASADRGLAININSKHKNEAFEFVEYALSEVMQTNLYMTNLPVNLKIYDTRREEFLKGYDMALDFDGEGGVFSNLILPGETFLPDNIINEYIEYIESAAEYIYLGNIRYIYHNILKDIIEDYYNDRITFEDLIDNMNSKLGLYYSE